MQARKFLCRKRFVTVDTLGLVLRVLVTAANVGERVRVSVPRAISF